ncbi:hypothetical protein [Streptomyces sp. NPDC058622]|uniref:hypothetical protein n=1 Tax=Streptomyces sp. NPDC058622 TaxID=3346562 RepID=UPI00365FC638
MNLSSTLLDPLAESAVIAVGALSNAAELGRWSSGAVEGTATALEVLARALSELSPEVAKLLEVIPAAVAALCERVERAPAETVPSGSADRLEGPAVVRTGLRWALAAHSLGGHRVHQLGPALLTITLEPPARALAVLLAARHELPSQAPAAEDERLWGAGLGPRRRSRWLWLPIGPGRMRGSLPPGMSPQGSPRRLPSR